MASRMLGVQPGEIGREGCDAFGEICNMIAGNFKNKISGLGNGCMLSVPTIISAIITTCTLVAAPKPSKSHCCSRARPSAFHFSFTTRLFNGCVSFALLTNRF
jgi:Chemotaxis phosphatase CheX